MLLQGSVSAWEHHVSLHCDMQGSSMQGDGQVRHVSARVADKSSWSLTAASLELCCFNRPVLNAVHWCGHAHNGRPRAELLPAGQGRQALQAT